MNASYDDPKYTAYVLGELDDAERTAVEEKLRASSEAMMVVAEIRATTERLARALQAEPVPNLAAEQRATLLATANENGEVVATSAAVVPAASRPRRLSWRARLVAVGTLAIAGGLLIAVSLPGIYGARELAQSKAAAVSETRVEQLGLAIQNYEDNRAPSAHSVLTDRYSGPQANNQPSHPAFREAYGRMDESAISSDASIAYPDPKSWDDLKRRRAKYEQAIADEQLQMQVTPRIIVQEEESENLVGSRGRGAVTELFRIQNQPAQSGNGQPQQSNSQDRYSQQEQNKQQPQQQQQGIQQGEGQEQFNERFTNKSPAHLPLGVRRDLGGVDKKELGGQQPLVDDFAAALRPQKEKNVQREAMGRVGFSVLFDTEHNTEAYDHITDNPFLGVGENPLSTFSIDVDTASYSNVRRFLMQQNQRPPRGAVRVEELVNYFRYDYPQPEGDKPFSVTTEVASCPWQPEHRLVRIGLKGRELPEGKRPPSNLVFLLDVSGSMQPANKLPLVKQSLKMLTEQLGENDKVSIVVYAGSSGLVLPSTRGDHREAILDAIDRLSAGGSTNGAQGIELAYEIATNNLQTGGVNRVILATDGDFNVGVTNQDDLVRLIEEKAKTGVFLTTLGFGMGNVKDSTLEKLADKGNGNYAYIDDLPEARKVLVEEIGSTLVTIAKDVKIQVEFNPAEVAGYRLIGYENRVLAKEDFNDDKKDAGEIGAGHTVTALYEVVVAEGSGFRVQGSGEESAVANESLAQVPRPGTSEPVSGAANGPPAAVDALKYQKPAALSEAAKTGELFTLKLRYKQPDGDKSTLMETPVKDDGKKYREASPDFKFAAAVASFGMILRDSPFKGNATMAAVEELAGEGMLKDKTQTDASYRAEFVEMVKKAKTLIGP